MVGLAKLDLEIQRFTKFSTLSLRHCQTTTPSAVNYNTNMQYERNFGRKFGRVWKKGIPQRQQHTT
jgi:hypothetical protein